MFTLMHGRAEVFRAIAAVHGNKEPADIPALLRMLEARVGREDHPKVCAEMLMYSHVAFTDRDRIPDATKVFDDLIRSVPESLSELAAIHAVADLTGYFRPEHSYEGWLDLIAGRSDDVSKQAYGELLFLYYARRTTQWAGDRLAQALTSNDPVVITGLAYGASEAFEYPHCRHRAADILCAFAALEVEEAGDILTVA